MEKYNSNKTSQILDIEINKEKKYIIKGKNKNFIKK
jgi:hypothetical protein